MAGTRLRLAASRWRLWLTAVAFLAVTLAPLASTAIGSLSADTGKVLTIASPTKKKDIENVLTRFVGLNPDITVKYSEMDAAALFDRVVNTSNAAEMPDIVWSSAMDRQIKLANDGYALQYRSGQADAIPPWANWKDQAYGTTAEPVVFIYNKRLLSAGDMPRDRTQLVAALTDKQALFRGRVGTYDPQTSGTGLLFITQDVAITDQTWDLVSALGRCEVKLYGSSDTMIDEVASGKLLLACNVLGSYAARKAAENPDIGIVWPADYTLLVSRVILISRSSANPEAGKRFVDYLLSEAGQTQIAKAGLGWVRDGQSPVEANAPIPASALRPIPIGIDLLTYLDQAKRTRFLQRWQAALGVK